MTDQQKTLLSAAILAAAIGVYLEISRQEKLHRAPSTPTPTAPTQGAAKPGVR